MSYMQFVAAKKKKRNELRRLQGKNECEKKEKAKVGMMKVEEDDDDNVDDN